MAQEFFFPVSRDDLQQRVPRQYYVEDVLTARSVQNRFNECKRALDMRRSLFVLDSFDILYSMLVNWLEVEQRLKEDAWDLLMDGCGYTIRNLVDIIGDDSGDATFRADSKDETRNALKMLMFLLAQFMELFDNDLGNSKQLGAKVKGRKKKTPAACVKMLRLHWDEEVRASVNHIDQLCKLPLHQLWEPPVIEEDFVNLLGDVCFRVLDNAGFIKCAELREPVTSVLAHLIHAYNYGRTCAIKLGQLLVMCEQPQPTQVVHIVSGMLTQHNLKYFVNSFLQELSSYSAVDLDKNTPGTNALSSFFIEFSQSFPDIAEQALPHLKDKLSGDPYSMRNCVLSVVANILTKRYFTCTEMDSKQRNKMDKYLDMLEDHVHDINGFVRSKCLQIWLSIVEAGALPYDRMGRLVSFIVGQHGSLFDVSANARKHSMKILGAMLERNPAVRVPLEELRAEYERELRVLKELEGSQDPEVLQKEITWKRTVIPKVLQVLSRQLRLGADEADNEEAGDKSDEDSEEEVGAEETAEEVAKRIFENFRLQRVSKAIRLFAAAHETFADNPIFSTALPADEDGAASSQQSEEDVQKQRVQAWTAKLKDIYMGEAYSSQSSQSDIAGRVTKQQTLVACLSQNLQFVEQVKAAIPGVVSMLGSDSTTDVLEAISFLLAGHQNGISECQPGFKKMLGLVWSKEPAIRTAVVSAYEKMYTEVYVEQESMSAEEVNRLRVANIVGNLTQLIGSANLGELLSLEKLVTEFMKAEVIDRAVMQGAWEKFSRRPGNSSRDRRSAVILLGMMAGEQPGIVRANKELLVSDGLSSDCADLQLVEYTCAALQKMSLQPKVKGADMPEPNRLPPDHEMFQRMCDIVISSASGSQRFWVPMMEQAVSAIYQLADCPDQLAVTLIRRMAKLLLDGDQQQQQQQQQQQDESADKTLTEEQVSPPKQSQRPQRREVSQDLLAKFLALIGHVALKVLVNLEVSVLAELKRRAALKEKNGQARGASASTPKVAASRRKSNMTTEDELGLEGASADDQEAEVIRKLLDSALLYDDQHLLSKLCPLVVLVCQNPRTFSSEQLQAASSLALAKLMLVSADFCEQNLQLLFTLAQRSESEVIRANLIVALGDLTKRFPNHIEPWTPNLYGRLRDTSARVRLNALNTLSHLILNDMIKVKGQISEMTTCICDSMPRIVRLAKMFFQELGKKGNALYNVLPDIINRLSEGEVPEENFKAIMDYLFPNVKVDRHFEQLVEKLCIRLRTSEKPRQWRDLAYCLNLMTYNERMLRKLLENISTFADKLHEPEVYNCFKAIVANAGRGAGQSAAADVNNAASSADPPAAPAGRQTADLVACQAELSAKIEEFHARQVDNEEALERAEKAAQRARKKQKRRTGSKRQSSSGADASQGPASAKRPHRTRRVAARIFDSDEEDDD